MTQTIHKKLNESSAARWTVLFIVSVVMMMGYVVAKEMSPLQYFLELPQSQGGLGWSSSEFGLFIGSRGFFNVYLLMLFVSGVILDKTGVRFAGMLSCVLMFAGTAIDYYAIAIASPVPATEVTFPMLGLDHTLVKDQVLMSALGFAVFGIGYELCGITVSKVIVKWFSGKEMALAMGIQVALARLGTALALLGGPFLAKYYQLSTPILVGLFSVGLGVVIYLIYCAMDRRLDKESTVAKEEKKTEKFSFKALLQTLRSPGFWLITLLCMLYYSALYPFLDFATKLMISKYGVSPEWAGGISSILPFTSIILTPLFGGVYDRVGKGASIMILGTAMLTVVLMVFALPLHSSLLAVALMLILGVAFSLLPSVLWPAVPKIVPEQQLGSAYSIIYYIQNIGLMLVPIIIGNVLDSNTVDGVVDYTAAMWVFTVIGALAIVVSFFLLILDKKYNYGLQSPNVKD
ncbi:MAG: MFS transporter [Bacteroidales bacterium]|nr:MFS transporter [Bacteroidales bacterium]